jgi:hypothetical protein
MAHLAFPISCGISTQEVAVQVDETCTWVKRQLERLRLEIEQSV